MTTTNSHHPADSHTTTADSHTTKGRRGAVTTSRELLQPAAPVFRRGQRQVPYSVARPQSLSPWSEWWSVAPTMVAPTMVAPTMVV